MKDSMFIRIDHLEYLITEDGVEMFNSKHDKTFFYTIPKFLESKRGRIHSIVRSAIYLKKWHLGYKPKVEPTITREVKDHFKCGKCGTIYADQILAEDCCWFRVDRIRVCNICLNLDCKCVPKEENIVEDIPLVEEPIEEDFSWLNDFDSMKGRKKRFRD